MSLILDSVIQALSPQEAHQLLSSGECDVVDVREPSEWNTGHLPGSRLVPLNRLRSSPRAALPKDRVLFVCAAGVRSQTAAKVAEANGIATVYNLSGGTRGWVNAGFSLVRE